MPKALFAKAWIATGHITLERSMQISGLSEEEMQCCHLTTDPLELESVLGDGNQDGPGIQELISLGERKRARVAWLMDGKPGQDIKTFMPASLIPPIEKHLSKYLFSKVSPDQKESNAVITIVFYKPNGREASFESMRKNTILHNTGLRTLRADCSKRAQKDTG